LVARSQCLKVQGWMDFNCGSGNTQRARHVRPSSVMHAAQQASGCRRQIVMDLQRKG